MAEPKETGSSVEQVSNVLDQFHNAGLLDLDKSVREFIAPSRALAQLQPHGPGEVSAAVIAWDGYAVVIASVASTAQELTNVARQLQQTTQRKG